MKKEKIEYLSFEDEVKPKVGRPRLASKDTKKKSLIIAGTSFMAVLLLLIFGYGTLFGFRNLNLKGSLANKTTEEILITDITPVIKDITIKKGTARKVYLTVTPAGATNKEIEYISSNEEIAVVDETGTVSALKQGSAKITAKTTDGTGKKAVFNIKVINDASGSCSFQKLEKNNNNINYDASCTNANIKEIQYKVGNGNYQKLSSKKLTGKVAFSDEQLNEKITFKLIYNANNSSVDKFITKSINSVKTTTKQKNGYCNLTIDEVKKNSAKYDITCTNAGVSSIAYKIGNGSYVGIDNSNLADTIIFEESDVTRAIYFKIEYIVDGTTTIKSVSKNSIIEKAITTTSVEGQ